MDDTVKARRGGETATHRELKHLSLLWAQAQGYSACALEVTLPRCRYRADVAAFRFLPNEFGCTAIFECKQASPDLRRDNRCAATTRERLETVQKRRSDYRKTSARALSGPAQGRIALCGMGFARLCRHRPP